MSSTPQSPPSSHVWVDHIPIIWFEPQTHRPTRQLMIYLPGFGLTKELMLPYLQDLAAAGFVALSLDPWQHGERGTESQMEIWTRVFGNFRRHMWPILGQTTLDLLRVIDWAVATLDVEPHIFVGGFSMGGDIAVAAAGLDHRVERIAAIVAAPDWLRPGSHDLFNPGTLLPPGEADAYAQYFYDHLNPLTHLAAFAHGPACTSCVVSRIPLCQPIMRSAFRQRCEKLIQLQAIMFRSLCFLLWDIWTLWTLSSGGQTV